MESIRIAANFTPIHPISDISKCNARGECHHVNCVANAIHKILKTGKFWNFQRNSSSDRITGAFDLFQLPVDGIMGKNKKSAAKTDLDNGRRAESTPSEGGVADDQCAEQPLDPYTEQLIWRQTSSALLYLLFYSILMFTLPFGSYFLTKHLLELHTDLSHFGVTAWSVIASVITIYIVIGLYAYHGYHEKDVNIDKEGRVTYGEENKVHQKAEEKKPKQKKI